MDNHKHIAIYGEDISLKSNIIKDILNGEESSIIPGLKGKKGVLFSNIILERFIEEEFFHDNFSLSGEDSRSIRTFSSGEQKKALLNYLLAKNPDFIILDNPFDALDVKSIEELRNRITALSEKIPVIQIFKRKNDLLPFINQAAYIKDKKVVFENNIDSYLEKYFNNSRFTFHGEVPPPIEHTDIENNPLICFKNVNVSYQNRKILTNINWTVNNGEFWHLKGPNGSGKTTLLTMITGDNPKAFGEDITLFGKKKGSGENIWEIKKKIGYFTPSMMDLFKRSQSCEQMIISGLLDSIGIYNKITDLEKNLAEKWLVLLGIDHKKSQPFKKLSQIHQRMILIARAMIKHPPLLILDEPSNGLDDKSAHMLSALINKMSQESNTAILYVSHRTEPDLKPDYIFELLPGDKGSTGILIS